MGTLRTILALLVVCQHLQPLTDTPYKLTTGGAIFAVKAFFVLSGFYMALVLHGQYRDRGVCFFYASRLSRLMPLYWLIGALTFLTELLFVPRTQQFYLLASPIANGADLDLRAMPWAILFYIAVSIGTTIGLDTGTWLGFSKITGEIGIFPAYPPEARSVMGLSPVPQAWTIGIELLFYFVAPFIVRRSTATILLLAAASLAFRFALAGRGLSGVPWSRSLFPSELIYFLMGVLAFRFYLRLPALGHRLKSGLAFVPIAIALLISPIFKYSPWNPVINSAPFCLIAACIPFLFDVTKDRTIDSQIGDLSYPIYISHLFVMGVVQLVMPAQALTMLGTTWVWLLWNLAAVILAAFALDRLIAVPIDRWRRRFGARPKNVKAADAAAKLAPSSRP